MSGSLGKAVVLAVAETVAMQIGEGVREHLARKAWERQRSRKRWEKLIAEAKAERKR